MADFRSVDVASALTWFPMVRRYVPVTQIRVQTPPAACAIHTGPGRVSIEMTMAGHPLHALFSEFVREVEEHAQEHASQFLPRNMDAEPRRWYACLDATSVAPVLKVSAFTDALFFDSEGTQVHDPSVFKGCSSLLELEGTWVTDGMWGVRWKVKEVKECVPPDTFVFLDDSDEPQPETETEYAFLD